MIKKSFKKPSLVKKEFKRPNFKKLCMICKKYSFIKSGWNYCEDCYAKKFKSRNEED